MSFSFLDCRERVRLSFITSVCFFSWGEFMALERINIPRNKKPIFIRRTGTERNGVSRSVTVRLSPAFQWGPQAGLALGNIMTWPSPELGALSAWEGWLCSLLAQSRLQRGLLRGLLRATLAIQVPSAYALNCWPSSCLCGNTLPNLRPRAYRPRTHA